MLCIAQRKAQNMQKLNRNEGDSVHDSPSLHKWYVCRRKRLHQREERCNERSKIGLPGSSCPIVVGKTCGGHVMDGAAGVSTTLYHTNSDTNQDEECIYAVDDG